VTPDLADVTEAVRQLAASQPLLRPRDLIAEGIPRQVIYQLHARHMLIRVGRGLYQLAEDEGPAASDLAQWSRRVPQGVVCLQSALHLHALIPQQPPHVWMAIGNRAWKPAAAPHDIRFVRMSPGTLKAGQTQAHHGGIPITVTDPAKTVADCFKYRNKIGEDVAIQALWALQESFPGDMHRLATYARLNRVSRVMAPYLAVVETRPGTTSRAPTLASIGRKRQAILDIAAAHHLSHVRVFGSVARGDSTRGSDIDLLVRCDEDCSLFDLINFSESASTVLGAKVDVLSDASIDPLIKPTIEQEAVSL